MPMNPTRKRRLVIVLLILAAATLATVLVVVALQNNMNYLLTPSQVQSGQASGYKTFRLGGMVKAGSIQRLGRVPEALCSRMNPRSSRCASSAGWCSGT